MKPILPREMLWTDKETMDEFFELDPINEDFFQVFTTLHEEPFGIQLDAVKVFNEVYYQVTRMVFEHPLPADLPKYVNDVKANLGWNYSAELVLVFAHYLIFLTAKNERTINKFFTHAIAEKYHSFLYWKTFKHLFEKLKKEKKSVRYSFQPCPCEVKSLKNKFIRWNEISRDYDLGCIEYVINLWQNIEDKHEIANLIKESLSYGVVLKRYKTEYEQVNRFINQYLYEDSSVLMCAEDLPKYITYKEYKEKLEKAESEKAALQSRIGELEAENERLKTLFDKKKNTKGKDRKFTLVQMVDYCKSCVEWNDAKEIVRMLNKLLRHIGTEADSELVDSIEEEFRNRCMVSVNSPGNLIGNSFNYGKREE